MPAWWGSLKAIISTAIALAAGALLAVSSTWEKLSGQSEITVWDACTAAFTPVLPLLGSIAAILGFVGTLAQLFGPKPVTHEGAEEIAERHGEATRVRVSAEAEATRAEVASGTQDVIAAISRDKIAATLEELSRSDADPELVAQFERVIRVAKERNLSITQEQAAGIAETAVRMDRSKRPGDDEIARLIEQGDYRGAARRKAELARARLEETRKQEAAELRDAATLALPFAPSEARDYLEQATDLDPTDVWAWIFLGRLRQAYDGLAVARRCFEAALQHVAQDADRMVLHHEFGGLLLLEGMLGEALLEFQAGKLITESLLDAHPDNPTLQLNLAATYQRIGDVRQAAGDWPAARANFVALLEIMQRLAETDLKNTSWQRDLALAYARMGDIEQIEGNLIAARNAFFASRDIGQRLVESSPTNLSWQSDLAIIHEKVGDAAYGLKDFASAHLAYQTSRVIRRNLNGQDPYNVEWQHQLAVSMYKIGDVALANGNLIEARSAYSSSHELCKQLAQRDAKNVSWHADFVATQVKMGDVATAEGDLIEAALAYNGALAIAERLAEIDPRNADRQRDVWVGYYRMASISHPDYPWSRVVRKMEANEAAQTLAPTDHRFLEQARQLAAQEGSAPPSG